MSRAQHERVAGHPVAQVTGVVLFLALAWWLAGQVDPAAWRDAWARVPVAWWPAAALAWLSSYGVRAWRLQQEWAHRAVVPWGRCLALVLQHNAVVLLLPFRLGEAGYVLGVSRQWAVGLAEASWSLLHLRLQDGAVLVLGALACLAPGGGWAAAAVVLLGWGWRRHRATRGYSSRVAGAYAWLAFMQRGGWLACALNWSLRLAVLGGCFMFLSPCNGDIARAAALGAEVGSLWPLQGPAGLGPFEAGAWAGAAWKGSVPSGLVDAALMTHLLCVGLALCAAGVSLLWAPSCAPTPAGPREESAHVTVHPARIP